jgi:dynein heavy chain 1
VRAVAGEARKLHLQQEQEQQQQQSLAARGGGGSRGRATRAGSSSRASNEQRPPGEDVEGGSNALVRCLRWEAEAGRRLLCRVEGDLQAVRDYLGGAARGTNAARALVAALGAGRVPDEWREGDGAGARTDARAGAGAWVLDVVERVKEGMEALRAVEAAGEEGAGAVRVWLGGLFHPEAFVTAARQLAARRLGRSLEELSLALLVADADPSTPSAVAFAVRGLWVEGAAWEADGGKGGGGRLSLSGGGAAAVRTPLPLAWLCWTAAPAPATASKGGKGSKGGAAADPALALPVYLDDSRAVLVGQVRFAGELQPGVALNAWAQRGAAVVAWRAMV